MYEGTLAQGCFALKRNETIDLIDYIKLWEDRARESFLTQFNGKRDGYMKFYSVDCEASYTKIFALTFALLWLLLF